MFTSGFVGGLRVPETVAEIRPKGNSIYGRVESLLQPMKLSYCDLHLKPNYWTRAY